MICSVVSFQKSLKKILVAFTLILLIVQPAYAATVDNIPQPAYIDQNYIVDLANLLNKNNKAQIDKAIAILEKNKNKAIYLVTVPDIPKRSTTKRFKVVPEVSPARRFLESILLHSNVKQLKQGNGILILISTGDRSIEIRSGFNLKYIIRDRHIQGIIDKIIIPKFKQKDFNQGILLGINTIIKKIDNPYYNSLPTPVDNTWGDKQKLECKARNLPGKNGYVNCPNEISYHGGSGSW